MSSKPRFVGEKVKLGELISKAKVERCGDRSFPVYSMTMHDGIVEQSGRFKKTIASRDTSSYKVVKKNQLVVGFPIDEGVIYVQNHEQPGIMSPAYNVWDFDSDRILPAYLEFVLHSPQSMAYYAEKMRGTTARRRTLTGDALKNMPVPVPSIEDQYAVVKTLNCIKSQLAATQQMLDKLDQLVKSRFVEMFEESDRYNGSVYRLADIGEIASGITKGRKARDKELFETPYLSTANVQAGRLDLSVIKTIDATMPEIEKFRLAEGDVLMTEGGDPDKVGRGAVAHNLPKNCVHQNHVFRVRLNRVILYPEYFEMFLQSPGCREYFFRASKQTTGIATINKTQLRNMQVLVPPIKAQEEFLAFASQVDKSRFIAQQQIEKLQMLYDSLAQDYFGD